MVSHLTNATSLWQLDSKQTQTSECPVGKNYQLFYTYLTHIIFYHLCLLCTPKLEFVWVFLDSICLKPVTFVKCDTNFSCHTCHNMLGVSNRCKIFDNFCLLCTQRLEFVWVCLESTWLKPVTFVKCDTNFSCHTCHNMLDESNRCKTFYHLCLLCTQKLEFVWVCLESICHKPVTFVKRDTNFLCHTCHNMLYKLNRCQIFIIFAHCSLRGLSLFEFA